MKQSEFKSQIEQKQKIEDSKAKKFWAQIDKSPKIYKNLICKNIKYTIGGFDGNARAMCWNCNKCGRSGVNYEKQSIKLRSIDSFVEDVCDLEEG